METAVQQSLKKLHFVATQTMRSVTRCLMLILLAALLSGVGVSLFHPALAFKVAGLTFVSGCLLISATATYRFTREWKWRNAPRIRRTR